MVRFFLSRTFTCPPPRPPLGLDTHSALYTQPQRPVSAPHIDFPSWGPWRVSPIPLHPARRSHPPSQLMSHPADIGFRHGPKRSALAQPCLFSCSSVPHDCFYSTSYTIHCQCFSLPRNERRPKKLTLAARVHGTVANEVSGSHPGQSKYCLGC